MEVTGGGTRQPACNNCRDRKTKCNRESPCSSCVAANLDCRMTRRASEKRQRVLISPRYDEAMENVDRTLRQISSTLQQLVKVSEKSQLPPSNSGTPFISSKASYMSGWTSSSGSYKGDSSFEAHAQRVTDALRDAASNFDFTMDAAVDETLSATQRIQDATDSPDTTPGIYKASVQVQYPELEGSSLPPLDQVLKLLRLAQSEKQQLFIDIPIIDEKEFAELCQSVYFAINGYSIMAWATVNTGLYYLFFGLKEELFPQIGVTSDVVQAHMQLLAAKIKATIQSLRLCQEPSAEACRAFAFLAAFCIKSGQTPVAWSLVSAASRMCIDLGWHRLPRAVEGSDLEDLTKEMKLFWHIYVLDRSMAFTLGRPPSIYDSDIATERPQMSKHRHTALELVFSGFGEYAVIVGEMHAQLFCAAAQREPLESKIESAKSFASRLVRINTDLKGTIRDDLPAEDTSLIANDLLDIIMHCIVTIAYRIVPSEDPNSSPLQCNSACTSAARQALSMIVRVGDRLGQRDQGWTMFLNILFTLVPFACFVVLAGNTVASSSTEDLALLSAAVTTIKPIASSSTTGKRLFDVCKTFHQVASFSVARKTAQSRGSWLTPSFSTSADNELDVHLGNTEAPLYEHVMVPQDWDTVMSEFQLGIGAGAMASFVEPYMPFDGRLPYY